MSRVSSNMSVNADVLAAGFRRPMVRRLPLRYPSLGRSVCDLGGGE
jgi:hypothetical protein